MELPFKRGEPDFRGLSKGVKYLIPSDVLPPEFIDSYGTSAWIMHLNQIKYIKTIKNLRCNAIIVDDTARQFDLVRRIIPYAKNTSVFTKKPELYEEFRKLCFKEFGVPIRINNHAGIKDGLIFGDGDFSNTAFSKITLKEDDVKIPLNLDLKLERTVNKIDLSEALYLNGNIKNSELFI